MSYINGASASKLASLPQSPFSEESQTSTEAPAAPAAPISALSTTPRLKQDAREPLQADKMIRTVGRRQRVCARTRAPTRAWRERLLARVMAAARDRRTCAIDERRAARVIEARTAAAGKIDSFWSSDDDSDNDDDVRSLTASEVDALVAEIAETCAADCAAEERAALDAHDAALRAADADAARDVDELLAFNAARLSIADRFVLCPVCTSNGLLVRSGVLLCSCGLRLDGGAMENISLDLVCARLEQVCGAHAKCGRHPTFSTKEVAGARFLMAECAKCKAEDIVI